MTAMTAIAKIAIEISAKTLFLFKCFAHVTPIMTNNATAITWDQNAADLKPGTIYIGMTTGKIIMKSINSMARNTFKSSFVAPYFLFSISSGSPDYLW